MRRSWRNMAGGMALLASVGLGSVAVAQEADAEALKRGTEAYAHKDYEGARLALSEAFSLVPRASTLVKLGLAELEGNHPVEATKHFREYLTHAEEGADRLVGVRTQWLPRAESRIGQLQVTAPGGAEILVDDLLQGRAPLGAPVLVSVGPHEVTSRQGTMLEKQRISAAAGQVVEVHFQRVADAPAPAAASALSAPVTAGDFKAPASSGAKTVTVVGLGTGALAALGIGIGFGVASYNAAAQFRSLHAQLTSDSACRAMPPQAICGPLQQAISSTNNDHALSIGFEVAGGVLAAAAVGTWVLWRPRVPQVGELRVTPELSAQGGGLTVAGEW